jgi:hypothetical protein
LIQRARTSAESRARHAIACCVRLACRTIDV